jgi:REP-associated tyrosine transposase
LRRLPYKTGRSVHGRTLAAWNRRIAVARVFRQVYYHVIWTTKNREPVLTGLLRPPLFDAIRDKCRHLGCTCHEVNAVEDHVHLALEIPPSLAISTVIGQIKGASSHVINERQPGSIYWQEGYGIVTFRKAELAKVRQYIATQEERHRCGGLSPLLEANKDADSEPQAADD